MTRYTDSHALNLSLHEITKKKKKKTWMLCSPCVKWQTVDLGLESVFTATVTPESELTFLEEINTPCCNYSVALAQTSMN